MLNATKSPFRTGLTIYAKRNGFSSLVIADDLRQKNIHNSLLGIAVIATPVINQGFVR